MHARRPEVFLEAIYVGFPLHILLATNVKANEQESLLHKLVGC